MGQGVHASQEAIAKALWKFMAVDELALSIAASGFFPHEPLMVASEGDRAVVVEGNRRLLAVKLLVDPGLRSSLGVSALPEVTPQRRDQLRSLPIVRVDRREVWNYLGFKHVNGPQPWDSLSKAEYIARVHLEYGKPLDDIAQTIGDRHSTVKRLFRGLMCCDSPSGRADSTRTTAGPSGSLFPICIPASTRGDSSLSWDWNPMEASSRIQCRPIRQGIWATSCCGCTAAGRPTSAPGSRARTRTSPTWTRPC
jgi:hypothetical protein